MPAYFELMRAKGIQSPDPGRFFTMGAIAIYKISLQDDPGSVLPFLLKKFARLWYATESGRKQGIILTVNAPMYLFSGAFLVFSWLQRRTMASSPLIVIVYFAIVHVVTLPLFRYMIPVMPLVVMFAGFAFVTILNYRAGMGVHETLETVQS